MFHVKKPSSNVIPTFPPGIKICPKFACKERECTDENCTLAHPRNASSIPATDVEKIALHFKKHDHGWISSYHFRGLTSLSDEAKSMFGGNDGITGRTD